MNRSVNKSFDAYTKLLSSSRRTLSNFIGNYDRTHQKSYQLLLVATKLFAFRRITARCAANFSQ